MAKDLQITPGDLSERLNQGLQKARKKLIEKEKKNDGYLVVAGKDGKAKKIPAKTYNNIPKRHLIGLLIKVLHLSCTMLVLCGP